MTEADLLAMMPFAATIGVRITRADEDETVGTLEWDLARTTAGGATIVVGTELREDSGRLAAQVTQTQAVLTG